MWLTFIFLLFSFFLFGIQNKHTCTSLQIGSLCGHYLFEHSNIAKRSIDYSHEHHLLLRSEPQVSRRTVVTGSRRRLIDTKKSQSNKQLLVSVQVHWVEQQHVKKRRKRDDLDEGLPYYQTASSLSPFSKAGSYKKVQVTDPLYSEQWYLVSLYGKKKQANQRQPAISRKRQKERERKKSGQREMRCTSTDQHEKRRQKNWMRHLYSSLTDWRQQQSVKRDRQLISVNRMFYSSARLSNSERFLNVIVANTCLPFFFSNMCYRTMGPEEDMTWTWLVPGPKDIRGSVLLSRFWTMESRRITQILFSTTIHVPVQT